MQKLVLCALIALLASACDDECDVGESQCVSSSLIRTCIPTEDGNEWLVHQCGANETCERGVVIEVDAGSEPDGGAAGPMLASPACVGVCEAGERSCVTPQLARVCIHGGVWQLDACEVGQTCDEDIGGCVVGDGEGTVQRCRPGARACASEEVEKVCDADGTAWVEQPCAANQRCQDDRCTADPEGSCDEEGSCLDNKTALRCLGTDRGFELVECEGDLYCEAGRCRGPVCALGSLCTSGEQIRECVDGKSYKDTQCGVNEVCQQVSDMAMCVPRQCTPGTSVCGDPRDPQVDADKNFTTCVVAAGGSNVPEWVRGECAGNTTCDPARTGTGNPCAQECTAGAQRCANDPVTGVAHGFQECRDDGTWGPVQTCNMDGQSEKQCAIPPSPNASMLPKAACVAPICGWVWGNPNANAQGACDGSQIRACQSDGTLGEPMACALGACRNVNLVTTADGFTPATCDATMACKEGEEICLRSGDARTPRYRRCANGVFGTELETCENDGACYDTRNESGDRRVICGAECAPGTARCEGGSEIVRCNAEGRWGDGEQCDIGRCRTLSANDASCVLECVPGSIDCEGTTVTAPDGYHTGMRQQRTCQSDGTWGTTNDCAEGRVCRVTSTGVTLGCVECVGPEAPGGNADASVDSRCDPEDGSKIQDCGDNNTWLATRTCSDGKVCIPPQAQTCGTCTGAGGGTFTCTDANLRTEQICNPCDVPLMAGGTTTIPTCTETAIAATADTATTSCSGVTNGGTPSSWAGEPDCCSGYQQTALEKFNASCTERGFGSPMAWGGVSDCCANYRMGMDGAGFAYCD